MPTVCTSELREPKSLVSLWSTSISSFIKGTFSPNLLSFYKLTQGSPYSLPHETSTLGDSLPGWLGASCGQGLRAVTGCATLPESGVAQPYSCTPARLLRQCVACMAARLGQQRTVTKRAARARSPWFCTPCRCLSRDAQGSGASYSLSVKRTRKSSTDT